MFVPLPSQDDRSVAKPYTWIHSDVMDDNIQMKPCHLKSCLEGDTRDPSPLNNGCANGFNNSNKSDSWGPCHIIDFSGLSLGEYILLVSLNREKYTISYLSLKNFS